MWQGSWVYSSCPSWRATEIDYGPLSLRCELNLAVPPNTKSSGLSLLACACSELGRPDAVAGGRSESIFLPFYPRHETRQDKTRCGGDDGEGSKRRSTASVPNLLLTQSFTSGSRDFDTFCTSRAKPSHTQGRKVLADMAPGLPLPSSRLLVWASGRFLFLMQTRAHPRKRQTQISLHRWVLRDIAALAAMLCVRNRSYSKVNVLSQARIEKRLSAHRGQGRCEHSRLHSLPLNFNRSIATL